MPVTEPWKLLEKSNFKSFEACIEYMHNKYRAKVEKNNCQNCSKCSTNSNSHLRKYVLLSCAGPLCNTATHKCNVRFKILKCSTVGTPYLIHRLNEHEITENPEFESVENNYVQRGLPDNTKKIIAKMIKDHGSMLETQQIHKTR